MRTLCTFALWVAAVVFSLCSCVFGPNQDALAKTATPAVDLPSGTYSSVQHVNLSCTTSDATIYYTLDGSVPTDHSNVYASTIEISTFAELRAFAASRGREDSDLLSVSYKILFSRQVPVKSVDGAKIVLDDGTSLVVPPRVLSEDVTVSFEETEPIDISNYSGLHPQAKAVKLDFEDAYFLEGKTVALHIPIGKAIEGKPVVVGARKGTVDPAAQELLFPKLTSTVDQLDIEVWFQGTFQPATGDKIGSRSAARAVDVATLPTVGGTSFCCLDIDKEPRFYANCGALHNIYQNFSNLSGAQNGESWGADPQPGDGPVAKMYYWADFELAGDYSTIPGELILYHTTFRDVRGDLGYFLAWNGSQYVSAFDFAGKKVLAGLLRVSDGTDRVYSYGPMPMSAQDYSTNVLAQWDSVVSEIISFINSYAADIAANMKLIYIDNQRQLVRVDRM